MTQISTSVPTVCGRRYFTESCKIFIAFSIITDDHIDGLWSSVFYRELPKNYCSCHNHRCYFQWNHRRTLQIQMRVTVRVLGRSAHLPTASPTEAANPMRACSDTFIPTDLKNSWGILKILVRNSKNTDGIYRWKFNATVRKILF
jgi:hypothetical protein